MHQTKGVRGKTRLWALSTFIYVLIYGAWSKNTDPANGVAVQRAGRCDVLEQKLKSARRAEHKATGSHRGRERAEAAALF